MKHSINHIPSMALAGFCAATLFLADPQVADGQAPAAGEAIAGSSDATIRLQFPNNPVSDILGVYELLTGSSIVRDTRIFDGKSISLVTAKEITAAEAVELIESSLQINGYVLIKEEDGKTVRATIADASLPTISEDLGIRTDLSQLPKGRSIVSVFMGLDHLDPVEATSIFWTHAGLNEYGRLTAVSSPPGLLITENTSMIRQFENLKKILDVPQDNSRIKTEFYELEHADATVIGQILVGTFKSREALPPLTGDTVGDRSSRLPQRSEARINPRVVADDRLNRIMVVAPLEDQLYAANIIEEFDQAIKTPKPLERKLQYVFVDETIPVLVDILQDSGTGTSLLPDGDSLRTRLPAQASGEASTLTGRVRRGVQRRETATPDPGGHGDQLINPSDDTAPISVLVGKTRLVADIQANNLLAYGPEADIEKINGLLDKLDRKPPQVYLATVIGQLTLGDEIDFGIDYISQFDSGDDGKIAAAVLSNSRLTGAVDDIRDNIISRPISPLQGLNVYGQIGENLDVFIHALESTDKFKVLSRPAVFAANNKKAVITSGQRIPVPVQSLTDLDNSSSVRTNIEFQDVVLKLEVIPLINGNKDVSLTIAQVNDTVVGEQEVAENVVPIIGTEKLTTSVTVPNRTTIVLGGLITDGEEEVTSGVPVLSRVPVLGHAFKSTRKKHTRRELIIFIQPIVVEDNDEILDGSLTEDQRTTIGAELYETFSEPAIEEEFLREEGGSPQPAEIAPEVPEKASRQGLVGRIFRRGGKG